MSRLVAEEAILNVMLDLSQNPNSATELLCSTKLNEVLFNFVPSGVKADSVFNHVLGKRYRTITICFAR